MGTTSKRRDWELESALETLLVQGMIIIPRYKIPTLLGRERERGEVWEEIVEKYEDIGGEGSRLRGKRVGDNILLTRFDLDRNPYASDETIIQPRAIK